MVDEAVERARLRDRETAASLAGLQRENGRLLGRLSFLEKNAEGGGSGGGGGSPAGSILAWVSPTIPANYAEANGQELDRTENSDLFAICGIRFGAGDGSTTFNTPNLTGKVIVASDVSQLDLDEIGKTGGASTVTLTNAEGPPHSHSATTSTDGNHTHQNRGYWTGGGGTGRAISTTYIGGDPTNNNSLLSAGNHSHAVSVGSSGGGDAHENMPPFIALVYIIKLSGGIGVLDNTVETVLIDRVADVESAIEGMGSPTQPITEVQIDSTGRSSGSSWTAGPTFPEITGFRAGSRVHLDFNVPMRNASTSWGGLYFEPQIRFDLGTWQSLGSSGYDLMNTGAQAIMTHNGAILVDPGISAIFSVQVRYYFKSYDSTVILNSSHNINAVSGTATIMAGDNGDQFFTKFIIKEILA
jgi:microcystin-dependent protein